MMPIIQYFLTFIGQIFNQTDNFHINQYSREALDAI